MRDPSQAWAPQMRKWMRDADKHGRQIKFYRAAGVGVLPDRGAEAEEGAILLHRLSFPMRPC